jgi:glycosyltransferase involved in cell wall biosynthesis
VFVHSERVKAGLMTLYGDRFNERVRVVPDPTVTVETQIPQEEARRTLGLPLGKPMILFFGGLRPDKGPDIFIEALSLVPGTWFAVIAGEPLGIGASSVQHLRSRLPEPDRLITRLGFVRDEEVMPYFLAADVVVLPYRKSFGGTSGILQRAAAAARPVIVTDVGDVGPATEAFGLGLVVPPESRQELARAMQLFLKDRERLTKEIRPRALLYAGHHDWTAMAAGVREAYETLRKEPTRR